MPKSATPISELFPSAAAISTPRQALNTAWLKLKPDLAALAIFQAALADLLAKVNERETEDYHKTLIIEFLKSTAFPPAAHFINTKERADLAIHNDAAPTSTVGVLFEIKNPANKHEFPTASNINTKALQELLLYYLRERITHRNLELKHLVVTNLHEWYVFNATDFERAFASDKELVKLFEHFEKGSLSG